MSYVASLMEMNANKMVNSDSFLFWVPLSVMIRHFNNTINEAYICFMPAMHAMFQCLPEYLWAAALAYLCGELFLHHCLYSMLLCHSTTEIRK